MSQNGIPIAVRFQAQMNSIIMLNEYKNRYVTAFVNACESSSVSQIPDPTPTRTFFTRLRSEVHLFIILHYAKSVFVIVLAREKFVFICTKIPCLWEFEWEWETMGMAYGNGTGMGIKLKKYKTFPEEWDWE